MKTRQQPPVRHANGARTRVILAVLVVTGGLGWSLCVAQRPGLAPDGMVWIPGGEFSMGAAVSFSRLWQRQGNRAEARRLLKDAYTCFSEGFDTTDLQEAGALLEELA